MEQAIEAICKASELACNVKTHHC